MLTKITIRNFKRFGDVSIDLDSPVVFVGPNNSGKTSAMQALTLWDIGVRKWKEKRGGKGTPEKRPGVTIGRRDLVAIPLPSALSLWKDKQVRDKAKNIRIEIIVEGVTGRKKWECGLEFDYANEESFYCRPLRQGVGRNPERMSVPKEAGETPVVLLPSMSGLATTETRLDQGAIDVRIGEGRTAEVLRNLCYQVAAKSVEEWESLAKRIEGLFGVQLEDPRYVRERGEVTIDYTEDKTHLDLSSGEQDPRSSKGSKKKKRLDLSSSGRGLLQTLLILSFMRLNPGTALLLDEPDAHLEILRQRQTYGIITEEARYYRSQLIAASHSEVLLDEAAREDRVVAFVGEPHRLRAGGKGQVRKALKDLSFDQYYLAEQSRWILYLEGPTDLSILREFAKRLNDADAQRALDIPFVRYVGNNPSAALNHYHGLKEALPLLGGIALFDKIGFDGADSGDLKIMEWRKREIENYFSTRATLEAYVRDLTAKMPLYKDDWEEKMQQSIDKVATAMETLGTGSPWSSETKVSDGFLVPVFEAFFDKIGVYNEMRKKHLHELVRFLPDNEVDPEIGEKLGAISDVARMAEKRRKI